MTTAGMHRDAASSRRQLTVSAARAPRRWSAWLTTPARRPRREDGSAVVEFVFLAVLLLVPMFYLVMTLARVQAGTYAVSAAAREAGRAFVSSPADAAAEGRARAAAELAFADQGFSAGTVGLQCDGSPCLRPDGRVRVTASVAVALPLVPSFFADIVPLEVPVSATHVSTVDRYRGGSE